MLYSSKILKLVGGLFIFVMPLVVCIVLLISCQAAVALSCVLVANQAAALGYDRPLRLLHHLCTVQVHMRVCITAERPLPSIFVIVWQFDWRMFLVILRLYRFVWVVALAISLTALAFGYDRIMGVLRVHHSCTHTSLACFWWQNFARIWVSKWNDLCLTDLENNCNIQPIAYLHLIF